ncbi:MAG: hypothetical protein KDB80_04680 [Planctomycetes bacterium]|nr:hypothetical protein [Planctomycetota bacterium]
MTYEPRTIAFGAELVHPPMQLKSDRVQQVHAELFKQSDLAYQNFQVANDGVHLSNPPTTPGSVSSATFAPDRIILREEFRPCTVEEFATRVVNVVGLAHRTLGIKSCLAQQFWTRSLVNPRHHTDSRVFVADHMLQGGQSALADFGRPMHTIGLRMTFPQSGEHNNLINLRIEPWPQDPRSLWLEVVGQFTSQIVTEKLVDVSECLYATYRFLTGPTFAYVSRFDVPAS